MSNNIKRREVFDLFIVATMLEHGVDIHDEQEAFCEVQRDPGREPRAVSFSSV